MAGNDYDKALRVWSKWPMREALSSYKARMIDEAMQQFRFDILIYTVSAPYTDPKKPMKQPEIPDLLREVIRGSAD